MLDSFQVRYATNLNVSDSNVNLTNVGSAGGTDPAGDICANLYIFSPGQQLSACCSCPLTPNHLVTLSVQKDVMKNLLTPALPMSITIAIAATTEVGGTCNASNVQPANLVSGLRAWGTTWHAIKGSGFAETETAFSPVILSTSELNKMNSYCGFIQTIASGYGICGPCQTGASGARKQ